VRRSGAGVGEKVLGDSALLAMKEPGLIIAERDWHQYPRLHCRPGSNNNLEK